MVHVLRRLTVEWPPACHLGGGAAGRGGCPPRTGDLIGSERGGHGPLAPANRDGAELDRLAGLEPAGPGTVRVGLVATYANWKGQDVFLDAWPGYLWRGRRSGVTCRRADLTTAGSQFTREELERQAATNGLAGRVGFVPFQPDPADVYRMLDVAVHASIRPERSG